MGRRVLFSSEASANFKLCIYVAYCVGIGRMAATYRIIEELPESFQDATAKIVPWGDYPTDRMVFRA